MCYLYGNQIIDSLISTYHKEKRNAEGVAIDKLYSRFKYLKN